MSVDSCNFKIETVDTSIHDTDKTSLDSSGESVVCKDIPTYNPKCMSKDTIAIPREAPKDESLDTACPLIDLYKRLCEEIIHQEFIDYKISLLCMPNCVQTTEMTDLLDTIKTCICRNNFILFYDFLYNSKYIFDKFLTVCEKDTANGLRCLVDNLCTCKYNRLYISCMVLYYKYGMSDISEWGDKVWRQITNYGTRLDIDYMMIFRYLDYTLFPRDYTESNAAGI